MNETLLIGLAGIFGILAVAAVGVPIAIAISLVAAVGMWVATDFNYMVVTFQTLPYSASANYAFAVIPTFVLMGAFATSSGVVAELYTALNRWLESTRGGLYIATTVASAGFAAISGSTVVNAALFTRMALPEMVSRGCDRGFSAGCIAASGTFAALIPPSLTFVVVGLLTGVSIGALFIAGIVPGVLTAVAYVAAIPLILRIRPDWAPPLVRQHTLAEKVAGLKGVWPMIVLVILVLSGIYTGLTPPTAAGAVGAAGTLLLALLRRRITGGAIWESFKQTAELTAVIFFIIISGLLFSRFLVSSGFIAELISFVTDAGISGPMFLLAVVVMYLILGMFTDSLSMLVVTLPFVFPVIVSYGYDPIWFGVVVTKMMEIAVITPPIGLNLFTVISASDGQVTAIELFKGILPFIVVELIVLTLLILIPSISTWLPSTMF